MTDNKTVKGMIVNEAEQELQRRKNEINAPRIQAEMEEALEKAAKERSPIMDSVDRVNKEFQKKY